MALTVVPKLVLRAARNAELSLSKFDVEQQSCQTEIQSNQLGRESDIKLSEMQDATCLLQWKCESVNWSDNDGVRIPSTWFHWNIEWIKLNSLILTLIRWLILGKKKSTAAIWFLWLIIIFYVDLIFIPLFSRGFAKRSHTNPQTDQQTLKIRY